MKLRLNTSLVFAADLFKFAAFASILALMGCKTTPQNQSFTREASDSPSVSSPANMIECSAQGKTLAMKGEKLLNADAKVTFSAETDSNGLRVIKNIQGKIVTSPEELKSNGSYIGNFKIESLTENPKYNPTKYKGFSQFHTFDATDTKGSREPGMYGDFVLSKDTSKPTFEAHYIFQAGDHMGGTLNLTCKNTLAASTGGGNKEFVCSEQYPAASGQGFRVTFNNPQTLSPVKVELYDERDEDTYTLNTSVPSDSLVRTFTKMEWCIDEKAENFDNFNCFNMTSDKQKPLAELHVCLKKYQTSQQLEGFFISDMLSSFYQAFHFTCK